MADNVLPEPPIQLKAIQTYMKVASDIERVNPVVSFWVRLFSTETALKIDRDSPECKAFLSALIVWLEKFKQAHKDNEAVTNQLVGQAHMENFVVALFTKVDTLDREGTANKNTVRMFFMASLLFEAMAVFGPLTDEVTKRAKYAKFKAAYIQKCLKLGQIPKPGPLDESDLEGNSELPDSAGEGGGTAIVPPSPPELPQPTVVKNEPKESPTKKDPFILEPSPAPIYPQKPLAPTQLPMPAVSSKPQPPPTSKPSSITSTRFHATNGIPLNAEDLINSQKYCKFANSALQYDDVPTAVANLEKALKLLTLGQRSD